MDKILNKVVSILFSIIALCIFGLACAVMVIVVGGPLLLCACLFRAIMSMLKRG